MHHAYLDKLAYQDSAVHRLDARVKLLAALIFTIMVIALPPTAITILACYMVGPFAYLIIAGIRIKFALKHILIVSPFIAVLALSCIFYDKTITPVNFGPFTWQTTNGTVRCFTITGKFVVTMLALIGLVSTTRFPDLLSAMEKFYVPRILITQLSFLYRYIFLLIEKAQCILRARSARKLRRLAFTAELKTASAMIGSLLISSINSAENVSLAMRARGFDGTFRTMTKKAISKNDIVFCLFIFAYFSILYFVIRPVFI